MPSREQIERMVEQEFGQFNNGTILTLSWEQFKSFAIDMYTKVYEARDLCEEIRHDLIEQHLHEQKAAAAEAIAKISGSRPKRKRKGAKRTDFGNLTVKPQHRDTRRIRDGRDMAIWLRGKESQGWRGERKQVQQST